MFNNNPYNAMAVNNPYWNQFDDQQLQAMKEADIDAQIEPLDKQKADLEAQKKDKKEEEIPQALKDQIADLGKQIDTLRDEKDAKLKEFGKSTPLVKQLVDLALLANNMLKGEDLNVFVNRSVELLSK